MLGPLQLERAYYHCAHCERGACPRDQALGLVDSSLSPGVLRMVGVVGAMVSFEEGDALLRGLAGLDVGCELAPKVDPARGAWLSPIFQYFTCPLPGSRSVPTVTLAE